MVLSYEEKIPATFLQKTQFSLLVNMHFYINLSFYVVFFDWNEK